MLLQAGVLLVLRHSLPHKKGSLFSVGALLLCWSSLSVVPDDSIPYMQDSSMKGLFLKISVLFTSLQLEIYRREAKGCILWLAFL